MFLSSSLGRSSCFISIPRCSCKHERSAWSLPRRRCRIYKSKASFQLERHLRIDLVNRNLFPQLTKHMPDPLGFVNIGSLPFCITLRRILGSNMGHDRLSKSRQPSLESTSARHFKSIDSLCCYHFSPVAFSMSPVDKTESPHATKSIQRSNRQPNSLIILQSERTKGCQSGSRVSPHAMGQCTEAQHPQRAITQGAGRKKV